MQLTALALKEIFDLSAELRLAADHLSAGPERQHAEEAIAKMHRQVMEKLTSLRDAVGLPPVLLDPTAPTHAIDALFTGLSTATEDWQRRLNQIGEAAATQIHDIICRIAVPQVRKKLGGHDEATVSIVSQAVLARVLAEIGRFDPRKKVFGQRVATVVHWVVGDFSKERKREVSLTAFLDEHPEEPASAGLHPSDREEVLEATSVPPTLPGDWDAHVLRPADPPYGLPPKDFTWQERCLLVLMRRVAKDDTEAMRDGADIRFLELCWSDAPRGGRVVDDQGNIVLSILQRIVQAHPSIKDTEVLKQRARRYWEKYCAAVRRFFE